MPKPFVVPALAGLFGVVFRLLATLQKVIHKPKPFFIVRTMPTGLRPQYGERLGRDPWTSPRLFIYKEEEMLQTRMNAGK